MPKIKKPVPPKAPAASADYNRAVYFDPGDRYTGVAVFVRDPEDDTWDCIDAFTYDFEEEGHTTDLLWSFIWNSMLRGEWDIVGYEVWRLFEDKAQEQKGKEFVATQTIGVIRFSHMRNAQHESRWPAKKPVELVRFLPEYKKPTMGYLTKRGVTFEADRRKAKGDHARDAELQGYYDIIRNRGWATKRRAPKQ